MNCLQCSNPALMNELVAYRGKCENCAIGSMPSYSTIANCVDRYDLYRDGGLGTRGGDRGRG